MHELEISRHRRRDRHPRRDRRAGADTNVAAADSKNATGKLHHDTTWQSRFRLGDGGISKPRRQPQRQNREAGAGRNDATRRLDHRQRQRAKRNNARRHVALTFLQGETLRAAHAPAIFMSRRLRSPRMSMLRAIDFAVRTKRSMAASLSAPCAPGEAANLLNLSLPALWPLAPTAAHEVSPCFSSRQHRWLRIQRGLSFPRLRPHADAHDVLPIWATMFLCSSPICRCKSAKCHRLDAST